MCELSENPGALSGNLAVAGTPAAAQGFGFPDITDVVIPNFCTNK
jgi:hypothetical protein